MKHLLLLTAFIIAMLALFFYAEVAAALVVIGYVLAGVLGVAALGGTFFGGWFLLERLRLLRAARLQAEKAAQVQIVSDNGETWVRDTDPKSTWRNLTGTPALYVTPQPQPPNPGKSSCTVSSWPRRPAPARRSSPARCPFYPLPAGWIYSPSSPNRCKPTPLSADSRPAKPFRPAIWRLIGCARDTAR